MAAIYARVSANRQKEDHTIESQVSALREYAETHRYQVPGEWRFQDEGYRGATRLRPGLEAVRDLAATGHLQAVRVYSPDRLSRKYAIRSCWPRSCLVAAWNGSSGRRPRGPRLKISCGCSSRA